MFISNIFDRFIPACNSRGKKRMFKKLALIFSWFLITPIVLSLATFLSFKQGSNLPKTSSFATNDLEIQNHVEGQVLGTKIDDIRPYIVANFLKKTPLEPHAQLMVEVADKYEIDYRLIPAIAMKESGGGRTARAESYNAWGFENGQTNFSCWESAIEKVAKTIKERYIAKGLVTPEQIMAIYAPPQLLTGGKWAKDINFFFSQMDGSRL